MSRRWDDKDPLEIVTLGWDLTELLRDDEAVSGATVSVAVLSGTDPAPGALLLGGATVDDLYLWQLFQAGVDGVDYVASALIETTAGNRYRELGVLRVRDQVP